MNPIIARAIGGAAVSIAVDRMLPGYGEHVLAGASAAMLGAGSRSGRAYAAAGRGATATTRVVAKTALKGAARVGGAAWLAKGGGWLIRKGTPLFLAYDILNLSADILSGDKERYESNTYTQASRLVFDHAGRQSFQARALDVMADIYTADPSIVSRVFDRFEISNPYLI